MQNVMYRHNRLAVGLTKGKQREVGKKNMQDLISSNANVRLQCLF